ncbi:TPA: hypothetical protein ACGPAL_000979 [Streptococcus suis]
MEEQVVTLTLSELKSVIKEVVNENRVRGTSIFNKSQYIAKRKHELHMSFEPIRNQIDPYLSAYHPMPDKFEYASLNHFGKGVSMRNLGASVNPHDLARKFALMCFGVNTNRDLSSKDEEKAVAIYEELVELFFKNYEAHLKDKFGKIEV